MSKDSSKPPLTKTQRLSNWAMDQLDPRRKTKKVDSKKIALKSLSFGPVAAIAITIGSYLLAALSASVAVGLYPAIKGWDAARTEEWLANSNFAQFFFYVTTAAVTLLVLRYFLKMRNQKIDQLGVEKPRKVDVLYGAGIFPIYFVLLVIITMFVSQFIPAVDITQKQELGFVSVSGIELILVFISLVLLPPLVEEFLFRGVLFTGLRKKLPFLVTAGIVSVIFGSLHLGASSSGPLWIAAIDTTLLSFVLCYLREKTGSIWAGVLVHFLKNSLAFIGLFLINQ